MVISQSLAFCMLKDGWLFCAEFAPERGGIATTGGQRNLAGRCESAGLHLGAVLGPRFEGSEYS